MQYSIGQFSKLCGLSIDTLRYYEKQGLIFSSRDRNNRRVYTDKDINWVKFILRLKKTGMSIKKMQEYARLRYQGDETIPQRLVLLFEQLDLLHQEQDQLNEDIKFIEHKIKIYLGLAK
ncbi:MerR family transcriptional regulator [Lactobacillus sp.]|uniref:MerR family transcriptional regulator n=1 Tax=Lactobacillus sp. TaxID=1591 RepID=UPI0025FE4514|nr:MerR family transcriptional regulator [Lactobacillus sp.]MCO6532794.1 MerR family transcriptional regulator [Lactobacillus sp.]